MNIPRLIFVGMLALTLYAGVGSLGNAAETTTLRLHQFSPPMSNLPRLILKPWGEELDAASNGTLKIEHFDAMALGGRPADLMDQARDGVIDIAMTLVGYTPGRFPASEVFELPFMMTDPVPTSLAYWDLIQSDLQASEFKDVKVLTAFVHGPGVLHTSEPVKALADLQNLKMRGPTRVISDLLKELGATPVGMPLPAIAEALSKGVVDGTVLPWEITPAIKLTELVNYHTEFSGEQALYTAVFVVVMNKARYESLAQVQRDALDELSGSELATKAATMMNEQDIPARKIAEEHGNTITVLDADEVERWKSASQPVVQRWVEEMGKRDIDGTALIEKARSLIKNHE